MGYLQLKACHRAYKCKFQTEAGPVRAPPGCDQMLFQCPTPECLSYIHTKIGRQVSNYRISIISKKDHLKVCIFPEVRVCDLAHLFHQFMLQFNREKSQQLAGDRCTQIAPYSIKKTGSKVEYGKDMKIQSSEWLDWCAVLIQWSRE